MIQTLIDKQDNFEVIRDQIAAILVTEVASQMALALADGQDQEGWELEIYTERSNPFEKFQNITGEECDPRPIVNIWYDNSNFDPRASDSVERQKSDSVYNIDCYGYGRSYDVPNDGHVAGDKAAAMEAHRTVRLVRNILMASEYTYLGLRGVVWSRWPQSVTVFQPQIEGRAVQNVVGARIAFRVGFNEFSPQYVGEELELVSTQVTRSSDGLVYLNADYEYPLI